MVDGDLRRHRRNPMFNLGEPDLACHDKEYVQAEERAAARAAQLAAWPRAIDAAVEPLDELTRRRRIRCSAASAGWPPGSRWTRPAAREAAAAAHGRLVTHVGRAAIHGNPDAALGAAALAALLGTAEAMDVDLGPLACGGQRAGPAEERLAESAAKVDAGGRRSTSRGSWSRTTRTGPA